MQRDGSSDDAPTPRAAWRLKMTRSVGEQLLSLTLCFGLVVTTAPFEAYAQAPPAQQPMPSGYSGQGAPLQPEELQQLVAPIAFIPTR